MNAITQKFVDFIKEEEGLTTVEYAIAGAMIAAIVIAAFTDLGGAVADTIQFMANELNEANTASGAAGAATPAQ